MRRILFLLLLTCVACSIKAPEVRVVGQRSLLEQQILGSYQSSVQDQWMLSMLRSDTISHFDSTRNQEGSSLLLALKRRRFNADDVQEFLKGGLIGEGLDGQLLSLLDSTRLEHEVQVARLIRQENKDRSVLLDRMLLLHPLDSSEVHRIFIRVQQEAAPKGSPLQSADGRWRDAK
jgi:hypothetical protein